MKRNVLVSVLIVLFIISINSGCAHTTQNQKSRKTIRTKDINKDGTSDVTYYIEGDYITKTELDTNYDGKTDVIVNTKDGKFVSAEADTDHNGTMDKEFTDASAFDNWINENSPDFKESIQNTGLRFNMIRF